MWIVRKLYQNLEEYLCVLFVGTMVVCLSAQVIVRIVSGGALAWAEELSRFCLIWTVYVGASLAARKGAHVRVSAQFILAPPHIRLFFRALADVVWMAFNVVAAYTCAHVVAESFAFPELSATLHWTTAYVEMVIPISCVAMIWRTIELYVTHWFHGTLFELVSIEAEVGPL